MRNIEKKIVPCNGLGRKFSAQGAAQQRARPVVRQVESQHVHQFGHGGFGGHVVAAQDADFLQAKPRFVKFHRDFAAAALRDVENDDPGGRSPPSVRG